jgi:F-type H+-transporting ATPase subunit delta
MAVFAARYARAFAGAVLDAKLDPADVQRQLDDFAATFAGSKDLRELLLNPSLPAGKRVFILDVVNRRIGCAALVRNFLAVLIKHERLGTLSEILEEDRLEMNRRMSISDAEVVTARPLADEERASLEKQVAELAGTKVSATFRQDKSVIGGAIVRIGSTIYDGSVRGRLERLKEQLISSE